MYYLQSRYYDPAIGRFINADTFATTDPEGVLSCNMFTYCENNPVNNSDDSGSFELLAAAAIGGIVGGITGAIATLAAGGDSIEVLTAAIAGMGSGAIAVAGPLGLMASAVINAYATYEIDLHAQRRQKETEGLNYERAAIKAAFSTASSLFLGNIGNNLSRLAEPAIKHGAAFVATSYFFSLTNAAINLPVSALIDKATSSERSKSSNTQPPKKINSPRNAQFA